MRCFSFLLLSLLSLIITHLNKLIGATAIEDKLQTGVPKTIHNLRRAGIKVCSISLSAYRNSRVRDRASTVLVRPNLFGFRGDS
jgi:hypothetical protein